MRALGPSRLAAWYFLAQAASIPAWWGLMYVMPASREWFLPSATLEPAVLAFSAPDLLVLGLASAIAGALALRQHPAACPMAWLAAGAVAYSAVFTLAWSLLDAVPIISPAGMLAAAVLSILSARHLR
jgi:hypothetical protein